jgi:hypothetical protein
MLYAIEICLPNGQVRYELGQTLYFGTNKESIGKVIKSFTSHPETSEFVTINCDGNYSRRFNNVPFIEHFNPDEE